MIRRALFALTGVVLGTGLTLAESRIVVLIGPPASGKTTQTAFLQKRYGFAVVSASELIQANPQAFNKPYRVNDLEPHSDPVLNQLVSEKLKTVDLSKGLILDGYPATKDHADYLAGLVKELGLVQQATIIQLEVPDKVVWERAKKAGNPAYNANTVEQQLKDYRREMEMIQVYFPNANIHKVDGTKKPAAVSKAIESILGK